MKITDEMIGRAIKLARNHRGKSQQWLGDELGITYQQVQKYEKGINRVSLETFLEIAKALEIKDAKTLAAWIEKTAAL